MPSSACLSVEEISVACNVGTNFVLELTQRKLLRPILQDGMAHYSAKDKVVIEITLKGLELDFSMQEIEALIEDWSRLDS